MINFIIDSSRDTRVCLPVMAIMHQSLRTCMNKVRVVFICCYKHRVNQSRRFDNVATQYIKSALKLGKALCTKHRSNYFCLKLDI